MKKIELNQIGLRNFSLLNRTNFSRVNYQFKRLIFLLKNLIDSGFGHRKFEEDSEKTYHDQRPWCPHNWSVTKLYEETQHLEHLQDHRQPKKDHHTSVELAPMVFQIGLIPLCNTISNFILFHIKNIMI